VETFNSLLAGFSLALTLTNLMWCLVGVTLGTAVGVLPGIGPAVTVALLLPVTTKVDPSGALIMFAGIYYGAMYGGSTTSILLNIPGEASSVVTCFDGYQMARQGRAGAALGISAFASFIAGTFSIFGLILLAPTLANFALRFGPPEYFALMVMGLTVVAYLARKSMAKALLMAGGKGNRLVIGGARIAGVHDADWGDVHRGAAVDHVADAALAGIDARELVALEDPFLGIEQAVDEHRLALHFGDPARHPGDLAHHAGRLSRKGPGHAAGRLRDRQPSRLGSGHAQRLGAVGPRSFVSGHEGQGLHSPRRHVDGDPEQLLAGRA
jgi:hypothetical protein